MPPIDVSNNSDQVCLSLSSSLACSSSLIWNAGERQALPKLLLGQLGSCILLPDETWSHRNNGQSLCAHLPLMKGTQSTGVADQSDRFHLATATATATAFKHTLSLKPHSHLAFSATWTITTTWAWWQDGLTRSSSLQLSFHFPRADERRGYFKLQMQLLCPLIKEARLALAISTATAVIVSTFAAGFG